MQTPVRAKASLGQRELAAAPATGLTLLQTAYPGNAPTFDYLTAMLRMGTKNAIKYVRTTVLVYPQQSSTACLHPSVYRDKLRKC